MIGLADFERRMRGAGDFAILDDSHLHRATREDDWGIIKTRDRLRAAALAAIAEEGLGEPAIRADLGDMIVFETAQGWRGHRWVMREGERIARETLIIDGVARAQALGRDPATEAQRLAASAPVHAPLGELRSGRGQYGTSPAPDLPPDFPPGAVAAATRLHRLWNARALDVAIENWSGPADAPTREADFLLQMLARLPDATLMIDRGLVGEGAVALLWRLHGHDGAGVRLRAIGSSVTFVQGDDIVREEMLIDMLSVAAQPARPIIDYAL